MHVCGPEELAVRVRFPVIPVVGRGEESAYREVLREAPAEFIEGLHIAVRPVHVPLAMIEVDIRHHEYAVIIQELRYFSELLRLEVPDIFENALGKYDVEPLVIELDGRFDKSASIRSGAG